MYPNPDVKQWGWVWGCLLISTGGGAGNDLLLPMNMLLLFSPSGTLSQCLNLGITPLPIFGFTPGLLSSSSSLLLLEAFLAKNRDLDLPIDILPFTTSSQIAIFLLIPIIIFTISFHLVNWPPTVRSQQVTRIFI